ncbi:hypothetical protein V6N13_035670 [Hibiscus sabdariffa]
MFLSELKLHNRIPFCGVVSLVQPCFEELARLRGSPESTCCGGGGGFSCSILVLFEQVLIVLTPPELPKMGELPPAMECISSCRLLSDATEV